MDDIERRKRVSLRGVRSIASLSADRSNVSDAPRWPGVAALRASSFARRCAANSANVIVMPLSPIIRRTSLRGRRVGHRPKSAINPVGSHELWGVEMSNLTVIGFRQDMHRASQVLNKSSSHFFGEPLDCDSTSAETDFH
jgi:hypothetical protein